MWYKCKKEIDHTMLRWDEPIIGSHGKYHIRYFDSKECKDKYIEKWKIISKQKFNET